LRSADFHHAKREGILSIRSAFAVAIRVNSTATGLLELWSVSYSRFGVLLYLKKYKKHRHNIKNTKKTETFHGGSSFSGIWWSFVFGVHCLWRHDLTSYSCFQMNVLPKFVDILCIFFYTHSLILCVIALNIKYQRSKPERWREILNPTTQQFITAKMSGSLLKKGSKEHPSLRQSNFQRQIEAPIMSCQIRAVEHRKCAAARAGAQPWFARSNLAKLHEN